MPALSKLTRLAFVPAAFFISACGSGATPNAPGLTGGLQSLNPAISRLKTPALITFDLATGGLAYFKLQPGGSKTLTPFTSSLGISTANALAADGDVVIIASYSPAGIATYNVKTKVKKSMSETFGQPYDVAVDKHGNIYAMNKASVAVYKSGSSKPTKLTCSNITTSEAIAVDNEGDVFVDGFGPAYFQGVIEYPVGQNCMKPPLRKPLGYPAGVAVDPKTDDLIVIDDPGLCAGGNNGRMVIYPKPYEQRTSTVHNLRTTYCAGTFRLDASSTHILYMDSTVSAGVPIIDQALYPSAKFEGRYWRGYFSSNSFSGMTTIPNRLPN